mmetsp:Transcript_28276/g.60780  ORF Transcript_28276/g.60780 Transcript_28276/m.60780 type:complete len:250 (+) Transcript_28276:1252-2001(+)
MLVCFDARQGFLLVERVAPLLERLTLGMMYFIQRVTCLGRALKGLQRRHLPQHPLGGRLCLLGAFLLQLRVIFRLLPLRHHVVGTQTQILRHGRQSLNPPVSSRPVFPMHSSVLCFACLEEVRLQRVGHHVLLLPLRGDPVLKAFKPPHLDLLLLLHQFLWIGMEVASLQGFVAHAKDDELGLQLLRPRVHGHKHVLAFGTPGAHAFLLLQSPAGDLPQLLLQLHAVLEVELCDGVCSVVEPFTDVLQA